MQFPLDREMCGLQSSLDYVEKCLFFCHLPLSLFHYVISDAFSFFLVINLKKN